MDKEFSSEEFRGWLEEVARGHAHAVDEIKELLAEIRRGTLDEALIEFGSHYRGFADVMVVLLPEVNEAIFDYRIASDLRGMGLPPTAVRYAASKFGKPFFGQRQRIKKSEAESFIRTGYTRSIRKIGRYYYYEPGGKPLSSTVRVLLPNRVLSKRDLERVQAEVTLLMLKLGFTTAPPAFEQLRRFVRSTVASRVPAGLLDEATDAVMTPLRTHYTVSRSSRSFRSYIRRCAVSSLRQIGRDPTPACDIGNRGRVTVLEACIRLEAAPSSIYDMVRRGEVRAYGEKGLRMVELAEVERKVRSKRIRRVVVQRLVNRGLKQNSAYRRIRRVELREGKRLEAFTNAEMRQHF